MLKYLKYLALTAVIGFIGLLALGIAIEANKSPEQKAADKIERENKRKADEEIAEKEKALAETNEPTKDVTINEKSDESAEASNTETSANWLKSITNGADWDFTKNESPIDGATFQTVKNFKKDGYDSEIEVQIKCIKSEKNLSITFESHVYDDNGDEISDSSAYRNVTNNSQASVLIGRAKWGNREPSNFLATLPEFNNVAVISNDLIMALKENSTASSALSSVLPVHFELTNGTGDFIVSIPSDNKSINRVLAECN